MTLVLALCRRRSAGSVPVAFGSLLHLENLNLAGNALRGALPGMPRSLRTLNVRCGCRRLAAPLLLQSRGAQIAER